MRSTEVVNARLDAVAGATGDDDWNAPGAPGADKLPAGAAGAGVMYDEGRQRVVTASGPRTHVWRSLHVREELGVDWQTGDVVTFTPHDLAGALVGVVSTVEDPHTTRGEAGEVRLLLELQG